MDRETLEGLGPQERLEADLDHLRSSMIQRSQMQSEISELSLNEHMDRMAVERGLAHFDYIPGSLHDTVPARVAYNALSAYISRNRIEELESTLAELEREQDEVSRQYYSGRLVTVSIARPDAPIIWTSNFDELVDVDEFVDTDELGQRYSTVTGRINRLSFSLDGGFIQLKKGKKFYNTSELVDPDKFVCNYHITIS